MNLLTDMLPAMTIALRPPTQRTPEELLHEGPEASLGDAVVRQIALRAATTTAGASGVWLLARATGTRRRASTVALAAVGTQLGQTAALSGSSPLVLASTVASAGALAAIVQTPGVSHFFGCRPLGPLGWTIAVGSAAAATGASVAGPRAARRRGRVSGPPEPAAVAVGDALTARLDYPMFVVTAADDSGPSGCLVGFATQCSIDPYRFMVCLSEANHTCRVAAQASSLAVHLLGADQGALAELFGATTGDEVDKFAACRWRYGRSVRPVPRGLRRLDRGPHRLAGAGRRPRGHGHRAYGRWAGRRGGAVPLQPGRGHRRRTRADRRAP